DVRAARPSAGSLILHDLASRRPPVFSLAHSDFAENSSLRPTVLGKLPAAVLNEHLCTCRENLATPPIEPCGIALPGRKAAQVFPFPRHPCQIVLRARTQQPCRSTAPHFPLATRKLARQRHLLPRICTGSGTEFIFEITAPPKF